MTGQMLEAFLETMQMARDALMSGTAGDKELAHYALTYRIIQIEHELKKVAR
jgi:hypothetical protein